MRIGPGKTLLAHKAINLANDLSGTERQVVGAIVDHFNRKTQQCDPAIASIAALLGLSERTVLRAVKSLDAKGYVRKTRHGGKFHRNSYELIWSRFEACDAKWNNSRRERRLQRSLTPVSGWQRQSCQSRGDISVTQTCCSNPLLETFAAAKAVVTHHRSPEQDHKKRSGKEDHRIAPHSVVIERFHVKQTSSRVAARDAAERRWNDALTRQFAAAPDVFAGLIDTIDVDLQLVTTEIELRNPGNGIAYLFHELYRRSQQMIRGGPKHLDDLVAEQEADREVD